jgi:hypothetical protein
MSGHPPLTLGSRFRGTARRTTIFYIGQYDSAGCCHAEHLSTTFVRQLLHRPEGATIARCAACCCPAKYRVWVKATADLYPVQSYLHRCGIVQSPHCSYCHEQDETLAHFTTICRRFREARTAGQLGLNQVRAKLASLLAKCLDTQWQLSQVRGNPHKVHGAGAANSVGCIHGGGGVAPPRGATVTSSVGNLQPDLVLVLQSLKRIDLLDLCSSLLPL